MFMAGIGAWLGTARTGAPPAVWIPAGFAVAAALMKGRSVIPALFASSALASTILFLIHGTNLYLSVMAGFICAFGIVVPSYAGGYLFTVFRSKRYPFGSLVDLIFFIAITAVASSWLMSAFIYLANYSVNAGADPHSLPGLPWIWAHTLAGILVAAPVFINWKRKRQEPLTAPRILEFIFLTALLFLNTYFVFFRDTGLTYLFLAILAIGAIRFGRLESALLVVIASAVIDAGSMLGGGHQPGSGFIGWSGTAVPSIRVFNSIIAAITLAISVINREKEDTREGLRRTSLELQTIYDNTSIMMVYLDAAMCIIKVNRTFAGLWGAEPRAFIGHRLRDYIEDEAGIKSAGDASDGMQGRISAGLLSLRTPSGTRSCEWTIIRTASRQTGQGTYILSMLDVTERVATERMRDRLNEIVEHTGYAIITYDSEGLVDGWNSGAERLYGFAADAMKGKPAAGLAATEDRAEMERIVTASLTNGVRAECRHVAADGTEVYVQMTASPDDRRGQRHAATMIIRDISGIKEAEDKLLFDAEILSNIAEGVNLVRMADGVIVYTNRQFDRMFGYQRGELIGSHVSCLNEGTPEQQAELAVAVMRAVQKEGQWHGEVKNRRKDGSVIFSYASVSSYAYSKYGAVAISVHQDITEKKYIDAAFRESENRFRAAFNASLIAMLVLEKDSLEVEDVNDVFAAMFGYGKKESRGLRVEKIWLDAMEMVRVIREAQTQGTKTGKAIFRTKDREIINCRFHLSSFETNGARHYLLALEDVTEATNAELETKKLLSAVEEMPGMLVITDREANIQYVNKKFTEVTGYESREVLGKNPRMLQSGQTAPGFYKEMWDTLLSGRQWIGEIYNRKKNGEYYWEEMKISPVADLYGRVVNYVAVKQDVTAARNALDRMVRSVEELKSISMMKTNFLAMISHELRTPLASIKGFSTFLRHGVAGELNEKQSEFVDIIRHNTERQLKLVNDLLDTARVESGTFSIEKTTADIGGVAAGVITDMGPVFAQTGVTIDADLPRGVTGNVDTYRLGQVISNLLANAARNSQPGSRISLTLRAGGFEALCAAHGLRSGVPYAVMTVLDTGKGIDAGYLKEIFTPFYQVGMENRMLEKGVGLGLYISGRIIEAHSGAIWAESEGAGKGAVFTFMVPLG